MIDTRDKQIREKLVDAIGINILWRIENNESNRIPGLIEKMNWALENCDNETIINKIHELCE